MKQYLLSILFLFFFACNVGFGQPCVDLSKQKQDLEKVITDIDNKSSDKAKLQQLVILFKPCVTAEELKNIRNTYLSLTFDASQQQMYKSIIKSILDTNKLLCVNFVNNTQQGVNKNYVADLDALLKEYEILKEKNENANTYQDTPTENNYTVFNKIKSLLSDCVDGATLKEIQDLNNSVVTENFGSVTTTFNANLKDIINLNLDLIPSKNTAATIGENPKTPVVEEMEKVEPEKSNFWTYMLYTLLLISILGNGYFLYKKSGRNFSNKFFSKKSKKKESQHKTLKKSDDVTQIQKIKTNKLEEDVTSLKRTLGEREIEVKDLKNQLKDAIAEIQQLKEKTKEIEETNKTMLIVENSNRTSKNDMQKNKPSNRNNSYEQILFFASPTSDGEFWAKNGKGEVRPGASIYIFYVTGLDATFEFYNDPSTFQATINDFGNRIKPVCDALNAYNPNATKIKTKKKGKAILQGDKWKVIEKAEIIYEV